MNKRNVIWITVLSLLLGTLLILFIISAKDEERLVRLSQSPVPVSSNISSSNRSKWEKNQLVVIPAIWKEINWSNRSSWPLWLSQGLDGSQSYRIHLYQRIDPKSIAPYDWPYCKNVHEEAGVYLKFIYDHYYDLPDKMLFVHAHPEYHARDPIGAAQCIRDDVHYASVSDFWIQSRPWTTWPRDPSDHVGIMYKCAAHLLTLFGFDAEAQLNPNQITPKDESLVSGSCCGQFYVTKQRIHHYSYEQWSSLYNASLQPYCTTELDREKPGIPNELEIKWFGNSLEHLWHVILGLYPTDMLPPARETSTDRCHLFRPFCQGTLCWKKLP